MMPLGSRVIPGINIQAPWSKLLLLGEKTVETRGYPLPKKYIGRELAIIETPGESKPKFRARIIGTIVFSGCREYRDFFEWRSEVDRHLVKTTDALFVFREGKRKFGWDVQSVKAMTRPVTAPKKRGIVFASACRIPI